MNHRYTSTSAVQPREHADPTLEARRLPRDIADHDLVVTQRFRCLGLRPSSDRLVIAAGRVRLDSIDPRLGGHVLLDAINDLSHHLFREPRRRLEETVSHRCDAAMAEKTNIPAPATHTGRRSPG